ncbi:MULTISPECIES: hypothetical protein [unclassified Nonomuraea]|uniref:hypothetical protein n=1 Tax=unclassified Nonomuraea TaxID=2593643 RepID=UPI0033F90D5D
MVPIHVLLCGSGDDTAPRDALRLLREAATLPAAPDLAGTAGLGGGDPDQVAVLVGEGEEQQAVDLVFAVVVGAVGSPGAAAGTHQRAVQQHDLPAGLGDLLQGAVQAWGVPRAGR